MNKLLCLLLLAVSSPAIDVYISTQDLDDRPGKGNLIGLVDLATGATSNNRLVVDREGNTLQMFDLAVNRKGELWGLGSEQSLWRIDPKTGISTRMALKLYGGPSNITGMTFHPENDDLYVSGNEVSVYRLNVGTCDGNQCAPLVDMSKPPYPSNTCAGDIEFHKGDLYFAGEFGILYRLKQDRDGLWYTAAISEVENIPVSTAFVMKGMVSDGETLWIGGDTNEAPAPHYLAMVDTETLVLTKYVAITGTGKTLVSGLATVPIRSNRPPPVDGADPPALARPSPPSPLGPVD